MTTIINSSSSNHIIFSLNRNNMKFGKRDKFNFTIILNCAKITFKLCLLINLFHK